MTPNPSGASVANVIPPHYACRMKRSPFAILPLLMLAGAIAACMPSATAGGSDRKKEALSLRVHGETAMEEGERFAVPVVLLDGRRTAVSIMPLLNERDIRSVSPFRSADGSYGVYLHLDQHGANLLTQYSLEHMGRNSMLVVMVNGRHVTDLLVDKPVRDGIFPIPAGLTIVEAARFSNAFPIAGREKSASEKKKKAGFMPADIMLPPKASDLKGASAVPAP
jgi:hypothetical protein